LPSSLRFPASKAGELHQILTKQSRGRTIWLTGSPAIFELLPWLCLCFLLPLFSRDLFLLYSHKVCFCVFRT